jgi:Arc/MetJ family transcription regulator
MQFSVRKTRSFSLDPELLTEIERTKGPSSASERVNILLRKALEAERKAALREEAAGFFANGNDSSQERRAFQKASIKSWSRG